MPKFERWRWRYICDTPPPPGRPWWGVIRVYSNIRMPLSISMSVNSAVVCLGDTLSWSFPNTLFGVRRLAFGVPVDSHAATWAIMGLHFVPSYPSWASQEPATLRQVSAIWISCCSQDTLAAQLWQKMGLAAVGGASNMIRCGLKGGGRCVQGASVQLRRHSGEQAQPSRLQETIKQTS